MTSRSTHKIGLVRLRKVGQEKLDFELAREGCQGAGESVEVMDRHLYEISSKPPQRKVLIGRILGYVLFASIQLFCFCVRDGL